jgi:hypothetical protein
LNRHLLDLNTLLALLDPLHVFHEVTAASPLRPCPTFPTTSP